jgi:aspartyl/asparaginyl-tRNA synthetase
VCRPVPVLSYKEAIDMLIESGDNEAKYYKDLTTPQEKVLGKIILNKYQTDF